MSNKKDISPLDRKIGEAIENRVDSNRVWERLFVDYIVSKAKGAGITSITDGEYTVQCVVNNPEKAQPKKKQHG